MTKKNRIKLLLKSLFVQFGSVTTDEGVQLLWEPETELMVGYEVFVEREAEDGEIEYVHPEDGDYKSGNTTFTIENGVCTKIDNGEVAEPEAEQEASEEALAEESPVGTSEESPAEETVVVEEEPVTEPEFDAKQAIEDLKAEYDTRINELEGRINEMKEQLDALLALPQDENAFSKESKNDNSTKPIFRTKK